MPFSPQQVQKGFFAIKNFYTGIRWEYLEKFEKILYNSVNGGE